MVSEAAKPLTLRQRVVRLWRNIGDWVLAFMFTWLACVGLLVVLVYFIDPPALLLTGQIMLLSSVVTPLLMAGELRKAIKLHYGIERWQQLWAVWRRGTTVTLPLSSVGRREEIIQWLDRHCRNGHVLPRRHGNEFVFRRAADAVLFKTRWL